MTERYTFVAPIDDTLENNLKALGFSVSIITRLRKQLGLVCVLCCGKSCPKIMPDTVAKGSVIEINLPVEVTAYPPSDLLPDFVYQDEYLAVVNKPANMVTVPVRSHYEDSLASVLQNAWGPFVYRPVSRLDKDTSGLLIVAKSALCASFLASSQISKTYTAVVEGVLEGEGIIEQPIALSDDGMHRYVCSQGKYAKTHYKSLQNNDKFSLVEFKLFTGRTHQIRVHSAYIGHPLVGDALYNPCPGNYSRHFLHCSRLEFEHPFSHRKISLSSDSGFDIQNLKN